MNRVPFGQDNRGERMRFSDNYYDREQMASNDRGQRTLREPRDSHDLDRGDYHPDDRGRIRGLMDKEIPLGFSFTEMESSRHNERYGKEDFDRGRNSQSASFRSQSESDCVDSSFGKGKGLELSLSESKYGRRNNTGIPWNAQLRPNCYLVPPLDETHVLPLSEKQPGCRTIFVGSLPALTDEFIVREIFNVCGPIENISFKNARKNSQVRYCQVTFYKHDSVEGAVKFNGHVLVIGDGSDRKTKISRIRVNYDQETKDNNKKATKVINTQKPSQKEEEKELRIYDRKTAFQLLDLLRHDSSVVESLEVMAHWFEKGECNRSTVNVFHTILSTIHGFVKRLIGKRKEHDRQVEKQKKEAVDKANEIKQQCEAVWKVFEAATKQKSWDHFTKGQRKTISQWHALIKNEIKSAQEAEIQNREEVGMDLDDDVPNLGGLIEQPALQVAAEHQHEQDQSQSPPKAKKPRRDASEPDAASTDALKLENEKLRTQVESLKGIAEQNSNLVWSMQSYQYQADLTRQQYSDRLKEKDHEILRLQKALQHIKQNVKDKKLLSDLERATSDQPTDLQIVVELGNNDQTTTNEVAMRHEDSKGNDGEEIKEEIMEDDFERKVEQITGHDNEVEEEKTGEEHGGNEAGSGVYSEPGDVSNKGESSQPSQTKQQGNVEEGDFQCEDVPIQGENKELAEISTEESKALGAEEEKLTKEGNAKLAEEEEEGKPAEKGEKPMEEEDKTEDGEKPVNEDRAVEGEKPTQELEIPTEQEEKPGEEEENPAEEAEDEEEGCGRFVQIDDEQFEVIDDMDEDSEDDYKEVAAQKPLNESVEQMNEQLPGKDDYKEEAALSTLNENVEQMNQQLPGKDDYKKVAAHDPLNGSVDQASEQLPSEDDYKEVAAHDPLNESVEQVSEQLPAYWSFYQQDYSAQYQTWPSSGMTGYGSMEFGPNLVRLSGEELVLVGIICSYLQLCPSGATSGEIRDYLSRQFSERRKDVVEKLLFSLPVLFRTGESSGNTKWKFCGFEMFQSKSEQ
ncbi:hypothetical protein ACROYT_G027064 [Oculina patagonica]